MKIVNKGLLAASSVAVLLALGACGQRESSESAMSEARQEAAQAMNEGRQEANQAMNEARQEAAEALQEGRQEAAQASNSDSAVMGAGQATATAVDDAQIVTKVKSKLAADDEIKALAIDVDSKDGRVTLTGTVPNDALKDRAADIVKNTEDVKGLDNQLTVRS